MDILLLSYKHSKANILLINHTFNFIFISSLIIKFHNIVLVRFCIIHKKDNILISP